jgi:hypothetical protein
VGLVGVPAGCRWWLREPSTRPGSIDPLGTGWAPHRQVGSAGTGQGWEVGPAPAGWWGQALICLRSEPPETRTLRGLACSATGILIVRTPAS